MSSTFSCDISRQYHSGGGEAAAVPNPATAPGNRPRLPPASEPAALLDQLGQALALARCDPFQRGLGLPLAGRPGVDELLGNPDQIPIHHCSSVALVPRPKGRTAVRG